MAHTFDTLPAALRPALQAYLQSLLDVLGDKVDEVIMYGGAVLGDFAAAWSDVDVCTVLSTGLTADEEQALRTAQRALYVRFVEEHESGWRSRQFVDGPILGADLVALEGRRGPAWRVEDGELAYAPKAELQPFDRYQIHAFGLRLFGRAVAVGPPTRGTLRRQLRIDLDRLEVPRLERPVWLASMLHWMARSLVFWRDGEFLGKTAALEREIVKGTSLSEPFALALSLRKQGPDACAAHHDALRTHFQIAAPRVLAVLTPLAG